MPLTTEILQQFTTWLQAAEAHPQIRDHHAMQLATVNAEGRVSSRVVLLKEYHAAGFVFFTNYQSHKSQDLSAHPQAALNFYWEPLGKQIRIEGHVEKISEAESDAYFASRPRESQLGAWASEQSQALESRDVLIARFLEFEARFLGQDVPRPDHWGGWRLVADTIEFWQENSHRLHDRVVFTTEDGSRWQQMLLHP